MAYQYPYQYPHQYPYQNIYQQAQQLQAQQMQNDGLVPVPNIQVAMSYPVGPGKSVTFKDENAPYIYTKTMGYSQLDQPTFEKYRLVKEDMPNSVPAQASDMDRLRDEVNQLHTEINNIKKELGMEGTKHESTESVQSA